MATKNQLQKALDECRANRTTDKATISKQADEIAGLKLALADCEGKPTPEPEPTPTPTPGVWRPFAANSIFNTPITPGAALDPNSQALCQQFATDHQRPYIDPTDAWAHPLVWAKATDPQYRIVLRYAAAWGNETNGETIRIPAHAQPEGPNVTNTDSHLSVVQPDGTCYDFWSDYTQGRTTISGSTITASWGGKGSITGDGLKMKACAASYGLAAGLPTGAELKAGQINHALVCVSKAGNNGLTKNFAAGPNKYNGKTTAPAMGQRFYYAYTDAEINAIGNSIQRAVIRALAKYGMYVIDNGGGFCKFESQYTVYQDGTKRVLYDLLGGQSLQIPVDHSKLRALA